LEMAFGLLFVPLTPFRKREYSMMEGHLAG